MLKWQHLICAHAKTSMDIGEKKIEKEKMRYIGGEITMRIKLTNKTHYQTITFGVPCCRECELDVLIYANTGREPCT